MRIRTGFLFAEDSGPGGVFERKQAAEEIAKDLVKKLSEEKKKEEEVKKLRAKPKRRVVVPIALGVLVLVLAAYLIAFPPVTYRYPHPATVGMPKKWTPELEECVNALWRYRAAVERYRFKHEGKNPSSLQELLAAEPDLPKVCPVSNKPYIFEKTGDGGFRIEAPDPKALGVTALYLDSAVPAPKIEP